MTTLRFPLRLAAIGAVAIALSACNTFDRIGDIGKAPDLTPLPQTALYQPVAMPMPAPEPVIRNPNSLWRAGARGFFKDQRASRIGDILTVVISIDDEAEISNTTSRSRAASENTGVPSLLGFEAKFVDLLPDTVDPSSLIDLSTDTSNTGTGEVERDEEINLQVAAFITQVLPNGNMVIQGRQEVRVNYEVRELQIAGVIRPEDIASDNTISHEKIAEARISYGGRGQITDVQQPRYGQQVLDIVMPF